MHGSSAVEDSDAERLVDGRSRAARHPAESRRHRPAAAKSRGHRGARGHAQERCQPVLRGSAPV
jgi:hypothetical protein